MSSIFILIGNGSIEFLKINKKVFLKSQLQLKKTVKIVKIWSRSYTEKASFRIRKNASVVS